MEDKKHICKYCNQEFISGPLLGNHVRTCKLHPNREIRLKKMAAAWTGKHHSEKTIKQLSSAAILAHKEGRAWNIGMSRWKNEPSYPEKFFMKVIENEFEDKNYQKEYNVGIYSLDFAWIDKKKVIEIDGDQHQRFEEYKERDKRKDAYLEKEGWKVLRIIWKDMCNNTKEEIQKCKDFILGV